MNDTQFLIEEITKEMKIVNAEEFNRVVNSGAPAPVGEHEKQGFNHGLLAAIKVIEKHNIHIV